MTQDERRQHALQAARDAITGLIEDNPEIIEIVTSWDVTIGEITNAISEKLRELIRVPPEDVAYDVGQAAHTVKMNRKHAEVAEMAAGK